MAPVWLGREFGEVILAVSVLHQGLVELYKLVVSYKVRQYWQALAYVVYGPGLHPASVMPQPLSPLDRLANTVAREPRTLASKVRKEWSGGAQDRLIQSFLLRAVGDNPVTEVSDADVRNVVEIVRDAADRERPGVGRMSRAFEDVLRLGERKGEKIVAALGRIEIQDHDARRWLEERVGPLTGEVSAAELTAQQQEFDRAFVPGVARARREMANALKAAEFKYHRNLHAASAVLAAAEAALVAWAMNIKGWDGVMATVVGFGLLLVVPRGTKSLTDALIAIGGRLKR
jgi:hypothetical protein